MLNHDYSLSSSRLKFAEECLALLRQRERNASIFLFGWNRYAERIARQFAVDGVCGDEVFAPTAGMQIKSFDQLNGDELVICCAGGRILSAMQKLQLLGLQSVHVFELMKVEGSGLGEIHFNEGFSTDYRATYQEYCAVYNGLDDSDSKIILEKIVGFRLSHDLSYLQGFSCRESEQYFESFISDSAGSTFLDVGGFDGYTSSEFIRKYPGYKEVHVFEPDSSNFERCRQRFCSFPNVSVHEFGLANSEGSFSFEQSGSASSIQEVGGTTVKVKKLDALKIEAPSFLKIDTEGYESEVIRGAANTISKFRPTIAVAAYHGPGQIPWLYRFIKNLVPEYRVRIRHYTESIYETVMFFLPKEK